MHIGIVTILIERRKQMNLTTIHPPIKIYINDVNENECGECKSHDGFCVIFEILLEETTNGCHFYRCQECLDAERKEK